MCESEEAELDVCNLSDCVNLTWFSCVENDTDTGQNCVMSCLLVIIPTVSWAKTIFHTKTGIFKIRHILKLCV